MSSWGGNQFVFSMCLSSLAEYLSASKIDQSCRIWHFVKTLGNLNFIFNIYKYLLTVHIYSKLHSFKWRGVHWKKYQHLQETFLIFVTVIHLKIIFFNRQYNKLKHLYIRTNCSQHKTCLFGQFFFNQWALGLT